MRHVRKSSKVSKSAAHQERPIPLLTNTEFSSVSPTNDHPALVGATKKRAKNVVDALLDHFAKWQPEVLPPELRKEA